MAETEVVPRDLEGFVVEKLLHVIGSPAAAATLASAKYAARIETIATPEDVVVIARILATQGGFVGIVGDLIALEAGRWRTA